MAEPASAAAGALGGGAVVGVAALIIRWFAGREISRLDNLLESHGDAIEKIKEQAAKQTDITALRNDLAGYHRERMEEIQGVHRRIDELYRHIDQVRSRG